MLCSACEGSQDERCCQGAAAEAEEAAAAAEKAAGEVARDDRAAVESAGADARLTAQAAAAAWREEQEAAARQAEEVLTRWYLGAPLPAQNKKRPPRPLLVLPRAYAQRHPLAGGAHVAQQRAQGVCARAECAAASCGGDMRMDYTCMEAPIVSTSGALFGPGRTHVERLGRSEVLNRVPLSSHVRAQITTRAATT